MKNQWLNQRQNTNDQKTFDLFIERQIERLEHVKIQLDCIRKTLRRIGTRSQ